MHPRIQEFKDKYSEFISTRNTILFKAANEITEGHNEFHAEFALRFARWAAKERNINSGKWRMTKTAYMLGLETIQQAARVWKDLHVSGDVSLRNFMMEKGYRQASTAYLFSAPLDAITAVQDRPTKYKWFQQRTCDNWLHVATINHANGNLTLLEFLGQYSNLRAALGETNVPCRPLDMTIVLYDFRKNDKLMPDEFKASTAHIKSMFGFYCHF